MEAQTTRGMIDKIEAKITAIEGDIAKQKAKIEALENVIKIAVQKRDDTTDERQKQRLHDDIQALRYKKMLLLEEKIQLRYALLQLEQIRSQAAKPLPDSDIYGKLPFLSSILTISRNLGN